MKLTKKEEIIIRGILEDLLWWDGCIDDRLKDPEYRNVFIKFSLINSGTQHTREANETWCCEFKDGTRISG